MPAPDLTRRHSLHALAALAWPGGALRAQAQGITIRLSHVVARQTPKGLMLERFAQLVHERSAGRIRVQIYPNSELYGDADEMQALQLGAVDMLAPSLSKFSRIGFPEFELFDLPFLFSDAAQVQRVQNAAVGQQLLAALSRQRLVGLGYLDNGFKHMSANRPLRVPAEFRGLRMRVQASRVIAQQMRALGAQPVVLDFGETRRALAMGVVDGTENPVSNFWTQGMHEVQTHFTLTHHAYLGYAVVAQERFWAQLGVAERQLLVQALHQSLVWGNAIARQENAQALAALREVGGTQVHDLAPAQRQQLQAATAPVYQALAQRIGPHWLAQVQAVVQAAVQG